MSRQTQQIPAPLPLVTLYIMSYNREAFIREALEAAFSQTYSPLEILISDNCSTDRSLQIIQEMVASYKGPHKIVINQNYTNLGLIGNVNKVFCLAQGELLVMNCDDDVSYPQRVQVLVDAWIKHDRKPKAIAASYVTIDASGKETSQHILKHTGVIPIPVIDFIGMNNPVEEYMGCGAVMTYHRDLFTKFGPIVNMRVVDDQVLVRRARLLGDILVLPDILMKYRIGQGESTKHKTLYQEKVQWLNWSCESSKQVLDDLHKLGYRKDNDLFRLLTAIITDNIRRKEQEIQLLTGESLWERASAFGALLNWELLRDPYQFYMNISALFPARTASVLMQMPRFYRQKL